MGIDGSELKRRKEKEKTVKKTTSYTWEKISYSLITAIGFVITAISLCFIIFSFVLPGGIGGEIILIIILLALGCFLFSWGDRHLKEIRMALSPLLKNTTCINEDESPSEPSLIAEDIDETDDIYSTCLDKRDIAFSYRDASGILSDREVTVERVNESIYGPVYFSGFCYLRMEDRTFRVDRIVDQVTHIETGETFSPESYFRTLLKANKPATFNYDEKTLVRIIDNTDYRTIREDEIEYYEIEIEVEPFDVMFSKRNLQILGYDLPVDMKYLYHNFSCRKEENEMEWLTTKEDSKYIKAGFITLKETPETEDILNDYLLTLTVPKLRKICKNLGEKVKQNKPELIHSLLKHENFIELPQTATFSTSFLAFIKEINEAYIKDLLRQTEKLPNAYQRAVWEEVQYDGDMLPSAQEWVDKKVEKLSDEAV